MNDQPNTRSTSVLGFLNGVRSLLGLHDLPCIWLAETERDDETNCIVANALRLPVGPSASIVNGMLRQYAEIGLPGSSGMIVRSPIELRPVIAIAEPIKNRPVANERMLEVASVLSAHGVAIDDLEIWVIDDNDALSSCTIGEI